MNFDLLISIVLGIGLSSAVGFRVFIPALITALAGRFGYMSLSPEMVWMASDAALLLFSIATVAEIFAYYFPLIDNALDALATPLAVICGSLVMASAVVEIEPLLKWPLAIIAGGGSAAVFQTGTSLVRLKSTGLTAGIANPIVSTMEAIISIILSVLSILLPIAAGVIVVWLIYKILRIRKAKG